jgi:hypothetical protein
VASNGAGQMEIVAALEAACNQRGPRLAREKRRRLRYCWPLPKCTLREKTEVPAGP